MKVTHRFVVIKSIISQTKTQLIEPINVMEKNKWVLRYLHLYLLHIFTLLSDFIVVHRKIERARQIETPLFKEVLPFFHELDSSRIFFLISLSYFNLHKLAIYL